MDEVANRQSWDERVEEGRSRRTVVPLEDLASVDTSADRPDPVSILVEQDATRLQELLRSATRSPAPLPDRPQPARSQLPAKYRRCAHGRRSR